MKTFIVEKEFEYKGYECQVVGMQLGHRCGYVTLPEGHKDYGVHYDELDYDVHGGLTFSGHTKDKEYMIGFDCGHYMDGRDQELIKLLSGEDYVQLKKLSIFIDDKDDHIWTTDDVERELKILVDQL